MTRQASSPPRAVYLCPICEQEMIKVGFCHLECPLGHYQEVCSDLFPADRVVSDHPSDLSAQQKPLKCEAVHVASG